MSMNLLTVDLDYSFLLFAWAWLDLESSFSPSLSQLGMTESHFTYYPTKFDLQLIQVDHEFGI